MMTITKVMKMMMTRKCFGNWHKLGANWNWSQQQFSKTLPGMQNPPNDNDDDGDSLESRKNVPKNSKIDISIPPQPVFSPFMIFLKCT